MHSNSLPREWVDSISLCSGLSRALVVSLVVIGLSSNICLRRSSASISISAESESIGAIIGVTSGAYQFAYSSKTTSWLIQTFLDGLYNFYPFCLSEYPTRIQLSDFRLSFYHFSLRICTYTNKPKIQTCDKSDFFPKNFSWGLRRVLPRLCTCSWGKRPYLPLLPSTILAGSSHSSLPMQPLLCASSSARLHHFVEKCDGMRILVGILPSE